MSLTIRIEVIGGGTTVVEGRADMKFSELYENIKNRLSITNDLKIQKNEAYLHLNRDKNKSLADLGFTNNCCLQVEVISDLFIEIAYGDKTQVLEIRSDQMKLSEFANLVKTTFDIRHNISMWKETNNIKKSLDLASQGDYTLKELGFSSSTTVRVLKDEIKILLEVNGEIHIFDAKKSDTFGNLNSDICKKLRMQRIECFYNARRLGAAEDGNKTLEELGFIDNCKMMVLDSMVGGFILLKS